MTDVHDRPALTSRRIPAPAQSIESHPFWKAAAEGKFLIKRCTACKEPHWYPRNICPFCHSAATVWEESKGDGAIYTFSVMRYNTPADYVIAYVTLDEGVSVLTNIVDADFSALKIGQRVKVKWTPTENGPPVFTFAPA